jgi:ABC-type enterochelin transport system permease subunit
MVDQAKVTSDPATSPTRAFARNTAEFVHDVVTLGELQVSLLKLDVAQMAGRLVVPAIVLAVGAVIVLSCVPILLAALALTMVEVWRWSLPQAFFFALGCGLLLGGVACLSRVFAIRHRVAVLERSRNELVQNVSWIKQVLKRLGAPHPSPERFNGN